MNTANLANPPRQRAAEPPPHRLAENPRQRESEAHSRDSELFMHLLDDVDNTDNVAWPLQASQPTERFATALSESTSSAASPPEWGPLQQKLLEVLPDRSDQAGQTLEATLMLPNLGEVGLALKPMLGNGLNITLRFARRETLEKLRDSREHCRSSLADSLGRGVKLEFDDREHWA